MNEELHLKERYNSTNTDEQKDNLSPKYEQHPFNGYDNFSNNTSSHDITERLIRDGKLRKSTQINLRPGPLRKSGGGHSIGVDLNAMSVASLYDREGDTKDMDTDG